MCNHIPVELINTTTLHNAIEHMFRTRYAVLFGNVVRCIRNEQTNMRYLQFNEERRELTFDVSDCEI